MNIYECHLMLLENTFFSSREINNFYQAEALIGNYALTYAFRFANAPYRNNRILYGEHLGKLNDQGVYITPAKPLGDTRFTVSQFNSVSETYWSRVEQNAVTTDVEAKVGKAKKARAANFPQIGFIKMLGIGSRFRCYVLSPTTLKLPSYIRLGKFMSKAKVEVVNTWENTHPSSDVQDFKSHTLLNPVDLPADTQLGLHDLYAIHPVPLVDNARLIGKVYALGDRTFLPAGMRYGVESLTS